MTQAILNSSAFAFLPLVSAGDPLQGFRPFQTSITCPGCRHSMLLRIEAEHLETRTACPQCSRALTGLIHRLAMERTN